MCTSHNKQDMNARGQQKRRKKLWEIEVGFHCSLIGTCLTLGELRKIYDRVSGASSADLTDHQIHATFVNAAGEPMLTTRLVHKTLERKFQTCIRRFGLVRTPEELSKLWDESLARGDVIGPYWALMTHPALSDELANRAFSDIHMLSHLSGASNRADLRRRSVLEQECTDLKQALTRQAETINHLREECQRQREALRNQVTQINHLEERLQTSSEHLAALENGEELQCLRMQFGMLEQQIEEAERQTAQQWAQKLKDIEACHQNLETRLTEREQECQSLEKALRAALSTQCPEYLAGSCPGLNLDGRCILYVGGRVHLTTHFRGLVEQYNGRFLYHDGGLNDAWARLTGLLNQADAIVCPLDCVSHNAMEQIKRFSKQYSKPLVMLRSAGLSSFSQALQEMAA